MLFVKEAKFRCKYCKRKFDVGIGSNAARLIEHLYENHPNEVEGLKNLYISDVVKTAYDVVGGTE